MTKQEQAEKRRLDRKIMLGGKATRKEVDRMRAMDEFDPGLAKDATEHWQGFQIKRGERNMLWVSENGMNPMPGACCFNDLVSARKGISALILTRKLFNGVKHNSTSEASAFWNFMELSK